MLRHVSLYSGAGGFDLGFAGVGISNIAAFDNDPAALKTHKANHPDTQVVSADLSFVRPSTLLGPTQASNIDILTLGPPCQGFSHMAGPRFDDERNHHLKNASLHILDLFPKVAIIENVTGSITKRHKWIWEALEQHLRTSGYRTQLLAIDMERLGLPQSRRRALLVAWRTPALNFALPRTSRLKPLSSALETYPSGNNSSHSLKPGSRTWHIAKQILPGQRLTNSRLSPKTVQTWAIPEAFGSTSVEERHILRSMVRLRRRDRARTWGDADPVALHIINASLGFDASTKINDLIARGYIRRNGDRFDLRHTFNGKYRRLDPDVPAPTVTSRFADPYSFLHPHEERGFTPREAARLQSFPDSFQFIGPSKAAMRLIGNAMPPLVAAQLAETTVRSLL